jgi:hypothetical protein
MSSYTWAKPRHGRVWHIYDNKVSLTLCGKYVTGSWWETENPHTQDDYCKKCKKELDRYWQGLIKWE